MDPPTGCITSEKPGLGRVKTINNNEMQMVVNKGKEKARQCNTRKHIRQGQGKAHISEE